MRIRTAIYQPTQIGENVPDAKKCDDGVLEVRLGAFLKQMVRYRRFSRSERNKSKSRL